MLSIYQNTISTIANDSVIQSFVADRVYPDGVDINPEVLPAITVHNVSEVVYTNPRNERQISMQISIWSKLSQLQIEQITERIQTLLDFQQFNTGYGTAVLRWQRQDAGVDLFESDRRIWHKALTFRCWARP